MNSSFVKRAFCVAAFCLLMAARLTAAKINVFAATSLRDSAISKKVKIAYELPRAGGTDISYPMSLAT